MKSCLIICALILSSCAAYKIESPTGATVRAITFCKRIDIAEVEGIGSNSAFAVRGYKGEAQLELVQAAIKAAIDAAIKK